MNINFYWYRETTEIYAAENLEAFRGRIIAEQRGVAEVPEFTEANKGEEWGDADPDTRVNLEDGNNYTLTQLIEAGEHAPLPCQIGTAYN
jgi:hypothetical protein